MCQFERALCTAALLLQPGGGGCTLTTLADRVRVADAAPRTSTVWSQGHPPADAVGESMDAKVAEEHVRGEREVAYMDTRKLLTGRGTVGTGARGRTLAV